MIYLQGLPRAQRADRAWIDSGMWGGPCFYLRNILSKQGERGSINIPNTTIDRRD